MHPLLLGVTDLADQAVVLPAIFVAAIALAALGWRRGAVGWLAGAGLTLGAILFLKLLAGACGFVVESASGHTASAALIAGGLSWMFLGQRGAALGFSLAGAIAIAATRLALGVHTWPDVLVGALIGVAGALATTHLTGPPPARLRRRPLALALLVCLFSTYGKHLEAEAFIHRIAHTRGCAMP